MKKGLRFLFCLLVSVSVFGTVYAAEMASADSYVIAIAETKCYLEPDQNSEEIDLLDVGQGMVYTGEMTVDENGRSWLRARNALEELVWIPAKNIKIMDVDAILENYPHYYDGFVFELFGWHTEDGDGLNEDGGYVNWILQLYQAEYDDLSHGFVMNQAPELVYCSWTDDVVVYRDALTEPWDLVKQNNTLVQYGLMYSWPSCLTVRTHQSHVLLPDNEEIEGPQTLVFVSENKVIKVDFTLEYQGGYSGSNHGWRISDVACTVRDRVKTGD